MLGRPVAAPMVVERSPGWRGGGRRLAIGDEARPGDSEAMGTLAPIRLLPHASSIPITDDCLPRNVPTGYLSISRTPSRPWQYPLLAGMLV